MSAERTDPRPNTATRRSAARRFAGATLLACAAVSACSADRSEPTDESQSAIAGGDPDLAHDNVFLLVSHHEDSGGLCTATLIAPNLLLTARHCVSPGEDDDHVLCGESVLGEPYPASAFFTTNAPQPREDSAFFRAADVRVPVQGEDTCGYDIALVILDQNVPAQLSLPAVPRIDREVTPGEAYTAVGYGENEDGNSTGARMRRDGLSIECEPGSCGAGVESTEFMGETGICSGDSGGPALDADGKVVGVVSRGGPGCSTPIYGTVTAWRDFLIDTATEAALLGGYEPPFWVTTGRSDPPTLPGAGGGGGAGGTGTGGAPAESSAAEGEPCSRDRSCEEGLLCYAAKSAAPATCVASCSATADCSAGKECRDVGGASLCVPPQGSADESGCSVSGGSHASGGLLAAALGMWLSLRRRRKAH